MRAALHARLFIQRYSLLFVKMHIDIISCRSNTYIAKLRHEPLILANEKALDSGIYILFAISFQYRNDSGAVVDVLLTCRFLGGLSNRPPILTASLPLSGQASSQRPRKGDLET